MSAVALVWLRRDLRLADNPALMAALEAGFTPLPLYIDDPAGEGGWPLGGASRAWLRRSLQALDADLQCRGSRLLLRRGDSLATLRALVAETGAAAVYWNRRYEPAVRERDQAIKTALRGDGLAVHSGNAALLREPWTIATQQGEPYRVFTPYWRRLQADLPTTAPPTPAPAALPPLPPGLASADIDALLPAPRPAWDAGFWQRHTPGEAGAAARLAAFLPRLGPYKEARDRMDQDGVSGLSPHLAFGEISPRQILAAVEGVDDARFEARSAFVRELGWREFSYHLLFHFPHSSDADLTRQMAGFDWAKVDGDALARWQRGHTGIPIVDAAMRELWATGVMHNRARMIVASLLTKNLRYHWRHGAAWFWDTLVDADLANNTQGWQWSAGTGADAAPYFRIFNPVAQGQRFDPDGAYVRRWVPELAGLGAKVIHAPWEHPAVLARTDYPRKPIVDLKASREAALAAFKALRGG
jgi:deoxyribodipyrimidine photo-lyase